jgi:glycogen synthase
VNVLYVCTEVYPLLKTGGLADVSAALSAALRDLGCDVRLLLPGFAPIAAGFVAEGPRLKLSATGGPEIVRTLKPAPTLLPGRLSMTGQPAYLLDAPALYHRDGGPYLDAQGNDWPDNAQRFALLAWAAAGLGCGGDPSWRPDVVHAHDWHAGLAPLYLQQLAGSGPRPATVFTVHNLAYQGLVRTGHDGAPGLGALVVPLRRRRVPRPRLVHESRTAVCRRHHHRESALRARNHDPRAGLRPRWSAALPRRPAHRHPQRSRLCGLESGIRPARPCRV